MNATLYCNDCLEILPTLGEFDLVFCDPPFNIGQEYNGFVDKSDDFDGFITNLTEACWNACRGVMVMYGPLPLFEVYLEVSKRLGMHRIKSGVWTYGFGQCTWGNFIDDHCHWIAFAKDKGSYTWNPEAIAVESARVRYKDKRIHLTDRGGRRPPGAVWGIPSDGLNWGRIVGDNKEKWPGHPNQLPQALMRRIILAYSNPGDLVLDPCLGSGTTGLVATREGRQFVGIDISQQNIDSAAERIVRGYYRFKVHPKATQTPAVHAEPPCPQSHDPESTAQPICHS